VQVTCDGVEPYQPGKETPVSQVAESRSDFSTRPQAKASNGSGHNGYSNGKNWNGHSSSNGKNGSNGNSAGVAARPQAPPAEPYKLTLILRETENEVQDEAFMEQLKAFLEEYRGKDEVHLKIIQEGKVTNLKWLNIYVEYTPDLHKKLEKLVGTDGLKVEKLAS
jgi:hypothetical protein